MATPSASELGQYFDFEEATMPDSQQGATQTVSATQTGEGYLTQDDLQNISSTGPDFNTDFSTHLPRYQKPAQPCDYCYSRGLECFIYDSDGSGLVRCSPCNALFRPCSFIASDRTPALKQRTALDTLDVVGEDDERCFGGLTGRKQMRSLGHMGPIEDDNTGEERVKKGAATARFPRSTTKVLKDWLLQHIDHPYPTDEEKELLKQETGISIGQISNWMANSRRRQKARPKRCASPSLRPSTDAMNIPAGRTWESLNPLERWKHSPPENEPAPMNAIAHAVETFDPPTSASTSTSYRRDNSNGSTGSFSLFKVPSISSLETGLTGMSSGSLGSHNSAYSYGSRHSLGSMNSLKSKERRRRRRIPTRKPRADLEEGPRLFQCTFCTDRFRSKYDWSRHEKSLHLSLEKWICAPLGDVIVDKTTGKHKCVYCDELEPSEEHLAIHNHKGCVEKGLDPRTFYRKDHLRQHLRLMHGCKMTVAMDTWKSEAQYIKSRCGFCKMTFEKWQDRIDHLAKEFRNGADMKTWKGCRGLDAHVAIHVTNAMPPYLIAHESKTPFPFSASNRSSLKQSHLQLERSDLEYFLPGDLDNSATNDLFVAYQTNQDVNRIGSIFLTTPKTYQANEANQMNPNATCWEILTLRLGRYAREYIDKHRAESLTDEMLQREARIILYSEADGWEQTVADNPEWLNLFKKAHGIGVTVPITDYAHHDVYEDLGLHSHSMLDPSFNVNNFTCLDLPEDHPGRASAFECTLSGTLRNLSRTEGFYSSRQSSVGFAPMLSGSSAASPTSLTLQSSLAPRNDPENPVWLEENAASLAALNAQCAAAGKLVYECAEVGLRSFLPLDEQPCPVGAGFSTPALQNNTGATALKSSDFQFPSWDQLPEDFQDPRASADFSSTLPLTSTAASSGDLLGWDNDDMNFTMDMDLDMDLDMSAFETV